MLTTCLTHSDEDVDIVVKLNGAMDFGQRSAVFELVGSLMASKLGIECPRPYLVWLSPEFIEAVALNERAKEPALRRSVGWNFGTELLKDSAIWAGGASLAATMLPEALRIFSFDGLIQNVDRRDDNPNLMTRGDRLCVFDHECAFSFLNSVVTSAEPWMLGDGDYMERHALRRSLRNNHLDWDGCSNNLRLLTRGFFDEVSTVLPIEWNGTADMLAISNHVAAVLDHLEAFETELQRRIA